MFALTDEQLELRGLARRVAREQYAPLARQWDADRTPMPATERKRIADLGLLAEYLGRRFDQRA